METNLPQLVERLQKGLGRSYTLKWHRSENDPEKYFLYVNYCDVSKMYSYSLDEMIAFLEGAVVALKFKGGDVLLENK
jgi:hypothetical protein